MSKQYKENGSALHIVLVVVCIIVILAALGYVVWKNVNKDTVSDSKTTQTVDVVRESIKPLDENTLMESELMTSDSLGIKYKLPASWTGGRYGGGDTISDAETTSITAPDGFTITMTISRLTRGWGPEDPTATVLEVQKSSNTPLTWLIVDHADGGTGPIALQIAPNDSRPKAGDKKVAGSSIYKLGEAEGAGVYLELSGAYATTSSLESFNSKNSVKQAKAIIESITLF